MAAPAEMTILDISGKFIMVRTTAYVFLGVHLCVSSLVQNKTLSDSTDDILRLQGVSWITRRAIQFATIYLSIKHYKDEEDVERIDITQTASGGISGTSEFRHLDGEVRENDEYLFGPVTSSSKRVPLDEVDNEFLRESWLDDIRVHGAVWTCANSDTSKSGTTWTAEQVGRTSEQALCELTHLQGVGV